MVSDRFAKFLGWTGLGFWMVTGIVDWLKLWEMSDPPHPMTMLALVIGALALLRTCKTDRPVTDPTDGGGNG